MDFRRLEMGSRCLVVHLLGARGGGDSVADDVCEFPLDAKIVVIVIEQLVIVGKRKNSDMKGLVGDTRRSHGARLSANIIKVDLSHRHLTPDLGAT